MSTSNPPISPIPTSLREQIIIRLDNYTTQRLISKEDYVPMLMATVDDILSVVAIYIEAAEIDARVNQLEWALKEDGWTDDSDVGLIAMSGNPLHRTIADEIFKLQAQKAVLEGKDGDSK
jgi:hypothetical protein